MDNCLIIRNEGSSNVAKVLSRHETLISIFLVAEFYLNTLNLKLAYHDPGNEFYFVGIGIIFRRLFFDKIFRYKASLFGVYTT